METTHKEGEKQSKGGLSRAAWDGNTRQKPASVLFCWKIKICEGNTRGIT